MAKPANTKAALANAAAEFAAGAAGKKVCDARASSAGGGAGAGGGPKATWEQIVAKASGGGATFGKIDMSSQVSDGAADVCRHLSHAFVRTTTVCTLHSITCSFFFAS
jgi:hypothetical protein